MFLKDLVFPSINAISFSALQAQNDIIVKKWLSLIHDWIIRPGRVARNYTNQQGLV